MSYIILIIKNAKILTLPNNANIYQEGKEEEGCYLLVKGGIKAKVREGIQKENIFGNEFYGDESKIKFVDHNISEENNSYKIEKSKKILQKERIKLTIDYNKLHFFLKEKEIFTYELSKNNYNNQVLLFGSNSLIKSSFIQSQKLTTSVYTYSSSPNLLSPYENILLYINQQCIDLLLKTKEKNYKNKVSFLFSNIKSLKQLSKKQFNSFYSKINLIYLNKNSKCEIESQGCFYLIYKGFCKLTDENKIIYDEGAMIIGKNKKEEIIAVSDCALVMKIMIKNLNKDILTDLIKEIKERYSKQIFILREIKLKKYKKQINTEKEKKEEEKKNFCEKMQKNQIFLKTQNFVKKLEKNGKNSKFFNYQTTPSSPSKQKHNASLSTTSQYLLSSKQKSQKKKLCIPNMKFNKIEKVERNLFKKKLFKKEENKKSNNTTRTHTSSSSSSLQYSSFSFFLLKSKKEKPKISFQTLTERIESNIKNWKKTMLDKKKIFLTKNFLIPLLQYNN